MLNTIQCSNTRCRKILNLQSKELVNLVITFKADVEYPPQSGRIYCNQKCFDETMDNVNVNVPVFEQVDILKIEKISDEPITYHVICRQKHILNIR